jgi:hypothetical protein
MSRLWQQAYHIDYLAADIIRYFWRSRRRRGIYIGDSYQGEIPSSDIDASVYESHVSHLSHVSSLHSTTQSLVSAPNDTRHDCESFFSQHLSSSDAASIIVAAAGRMLWQQAFHVDYLASSIISKFWRSYKRRHSFDSMQIQSIQHKSNQRDETNFVEGNNHALTVDDAKLILHAAMVRAVWRQGLIIDYTAALIIAQHWRKVKCKRKMMFPKEHVATLMDNSPTSSVRSPFKVEETANEAAPPVETTEVESQTTIAEITSSYTEARVPSRASRKAFVALMRASQTGEVERILRDLTVKISPHVSGHTNDSCNLEIREADIIASIKSAVGNLELLPHETVAELLTQSGIFVASAVTSMTDRLKARNPLFVGYVNVLAIFQSL